MPPIDDKKIGFKIPIPIPAGPNWLMSGGQSIMAELIYQPEAKMKIKEEMDEAIAAIIELGYVVNYIVVDYDRWKNLLVSGDGTYEWVERYEEIPLIVLGQPIPKPIAVPDYRSLFYLIERLRAMGDVE